MQAEQHATDIFAAAIKAVHPSVILPPCICRKDDSLCLGPYTIPFQSTNKLVVIAAGKAAAEMALVAEKQGGELFTRALCITKYHHALPLRYFQTIEAAHPVPDANSVHASAAVLQSVDGLTENDVVLLLLSGGASSLLADIPGELTLEDIQHISALLVRSGASIHEMNIVRKHLGTIKGGQLAKAAYPAKLAAFILSDVIGDDLSAIASGPVVPDPSTFTDAKEILRHYNLWEEVPPAIRAYIQKGIAGVIAETPKPGEHFFEKTHITIAGNNHLALQAAAKQAAAMGYHTIIKDKLLDGDTEQEAKDFFELVKKYEGKRPVCILAGGETTIKVTGNGKGGRNQHFVLCALNEWRKIRQENALPRFTLFSAGTDGTDGPTDAAGAMFSNMRVPMELFENNDIAGYLERFDAYHFFEKYGGLIKTGPTQTNVMDIACLLIHD